MGPLQFFKRLTKKFQNGFASATESGIVIDDPYNILGIPKETISEVSNHVLEELYRGYPIPTIDVIISVAKINGVAFTKSISNRKKRVVLSKSYIERNSHSGTSGAVDPGFAGENVPRRGTDGGFAAYVPPTGGTREILGVIAHELTHAYQNNGHGTLSPTVTEGIADFIRLKVGLGAKHWNNERNLQSNPLWDKGYETTGYFFLYLDMLYPRIISDFNAELATEGYSAGWFQGKTGKSVNTLWEEYKRYMMVK